MRWRSCSRRPQGEGRAARRQSARGPCPVLLGTRAGIAPFLSIIKDPQTHERFERIAVADGWRWARELAYGEFIADEPPSDQFVGDSVRRTLLYYPTVAREPFRNQGRISRLLTSGKLADDLGLPAIDRQSDRVMLCDSRAMLADSRAILEARGFEDGNRDQPGECT